MARLLGAETDASTGLRELIEKGEMVLAPGCYDALGARLIEEAAFGAAYMTEKCGHTEGKQIVPSAEMAAKVAAAVAARTSPEFLVIARTDARAVEGLDAAISRARAYREAGADALFVEAPQSEAEIEAVARAFPDVPLLFNYAEGGKTPAVTHGFLRDLGFSIVIFPLSVLLAATGAIRSVLSRIKVDGTPIELLQSLPAFGEFLDFIGMEEIRELERRFADG